MVRGLVIPEVEDDFSADPVELFFDLAYVFAISQLVKLVLADPTWSVLGEVALLLMLLWMPWQQFTWSANATSGSTRSVRLLFLIATAASVPMVASVSTAFEGGGPLFAVPLAMIFATAMALMLWGLDSGSPEYRSSLRYSAPSMVAMGVIVVGAFVDGGARVAVWIVGLAIFIVATLRAGGDEWIVRTGHFAERHALIVIVALGEVIVALGNSIVDPLDDEGYVDRAIVVGLIAAGALAGLLWWSYFDRVQPAFEHRAESLTGTVRARFVRDVYTYGHLPLVAGIILIAAALEEMTLHPTDPLPIAFRVIAASGFVLYFGGISLAVYRSFHVLAKERVIAVIAIIVLMALGGSLDAIVLLVIVDALMIVALATEHLRIERPASNDQPADHARGQTPGVTG